VEPALQRDVERPLARFEPRDGVASDVLFEMLRLDVGLVARFIHVLLVQEEDARVVRRAVGLVEQAPRLFARQGTHHLQNRTYIFLFARLGSVRGRNDVCHVSFNSCRIQLVAQCRAEKSLAIGGVTGAVMALMFVKILAPLFTIQPTALTVPAAQLATIAILVLAGMGLSVALAARSLRRLNPVELLREE
jgi:hypothetical protein